MRNENLLEKLRFFQSMYQTPDPVLTETIDELESLYNTIDTMEVLISNLEKELHYE